MPTDPAERAVYDLLSAIVPHPYKNPGLYETPRRFSSALREMISGYNDDPDQYVKVFDESYDGLVVVRDIAFTSLCEHHLLPFVGFASVGYIPDRTGKVLGLSKVARVVSAFARRLQTQERLTKQIVDFLDSRLKPQGVAVVLNSHHSCMSCRGVKQPDARMVTSDFRGAFKDPSARAEFLSLIE